jgi:CHRD domain
MVPVLFRRAALTLAVVTCVAWAGQAEAASVPFEVPLSGAQQVPPVTTAGTGMGNLTWDPSTRVVTWSVTYSGLASSVTMAHFHGPAPRGKNASIEIWLTKQGSPVASPITGEATLTPQQAKQFEAGDWYINVHTSDHPAGELRGQVVPPKG